VGCFSLQQTDTEPSSQADLLNPSSNTITTIGGGPAGSAAAIAARALGARVELFEKSRTPRHKVCGEFLSQGIVPILDQLGVWHTVQSAGAASIRRVALHFPRTEKRAALPEAGFGLSRFALDAILLQRAVETGAHLRRCSGMNGPRRVILASGRVATTTPGSRGDRLFGFKAHFEGPQDDAVELFFARGIYVGVSSIEGGRTNVCGLAREHLLAENGFDYDATCSTIPALSARLLPLNRCMDWLTVGPVLYSNNLRAPGCDEVYLAGDALAFVDPFTGTGITNAVFSGELAGRCAAQGIPSAEYLLKCRRAMSRGYAASAFLRRAFDSGWADWLAPISNAAMLYRATRPSPGQHTKENR
jgi:hypothetical protein